MNGLVPCGHKAKTATQNPREDLESRSPNLGPYTTKGTLWEPPIKGSTFWILPRVWVVILPGFPESCGALWGLYP